MQSNSIYQQKNLTQEENYKDFKILKIQINKTSFKTHVQSKFSKKETKKTNDFQKEKKITKNFQNFKNVKTITGEEEKKTNNSINSEKDFTKKEKIQILNLNLQYGNKWTKISSFFHNRTERKIKNQFFSLLRKSLRTICRIKGIKNGTYLLNKIKTQSLSTFITHDLEINFEEMKKNRGINFEEKNFVLNLFEYIKTYAFLKFSDFRNRIGIKDIFIACKCIDFLIKLDSERSRSLYEKQKIYQKNKIFVKNQYSCSFEKINNSQKSDLEFKTKMIFELEKFKDFTSNLIEKMKFDNELQMDDFKTKNYEVENIYSKNIQKKKQFLNNEKSKNSTSFDRSVLLLFKKFNKN